MKKKIEIVESKQQGVVKAVKVTNKALETIFEDGATARCGKNDTYDFEVGALIALMRTCGPEKVKQASKEFFKASDTGGSEKEVELEAKLNEAKNYITMLESELRHAITKEESDKKDKEIDKLKKEIEYLKPRTWFADAVDNLRHALKQMSKAVEETKNKRKLTKREKFWHDVKENIKEYGGQYVCVYPKDYCYFIAELEKEIPTGVWGCGSKPSELDPWRSERRRYVYLDFKGFIYWSSNPTKRIATTTNKKVFTYHPPMNWEDFKNRKVVIKVSSVKELEEFTAAGLWKTERLKTLTMDERRYLVNHKGSVFCISDDEDYDITEKLFNELQIVNWRDVR